MPMFFRERILKKSVQAAGDLVAEATKTEKERKRNCELEKAHD